MVELDEDAGVLGVVRAREWDTLRKCDTAAVIDLDLQAVRVELGTHDLERDVQSENLCISLINI